MVTAADCYVRRPSELHLTTQRRAQQLGACANHLRIAAERKANRIGAVFAECIARRAADAVRRKPRRQFFGVLHSEPLVDRWLELGPDVEGTTRREWTHAR